MFELYNKLMINKEIEASELTPEEIQEIESILFDKIEAGIILNQNELCWIVNSEYDFDTVLIEVERHGWIHYEWIYKIRGKLYSLTAYENDMAGTEFDDQALVEVEARPVTITEYVHLERKN